MSAPTHEEIDQIWKALATGDLDPALDSLSPDLTGSLAGGGERWANLESRDHLAEAMITLAEYSGRTFHQQGSCLYADDDCAVILVRETLTSAKSGEKFDELALYINTFGEDGKVETLRTHYVPAIPSGPRKRSCKPL